MKAAADPSCDERYAEAPKQIQTTTAAAAARDVAATDSELVAGLAPSQLTCVDAKTALRPLSAMGSPASTMTMKSHTDFVELDSLPDLVHKQRRLIAGQLRITREERAMREDIDKLLEVAGVDVVRCETPLGPFEVRRQVAGNGNRYASVTQIKQGT